MKVFKYVLLAIFAFSTAKAVDFEELSISAKDFQKLSVEDQKEYLKLMNQIVYGLEAMHGPTTDLVAQAKPPFFLIRFPTAYAADPVENVNWKDGQMCLYGGYKSTAKTSGGKTFCPRPAAPDGAKCATSYLGKPHADGFTCNTWGFRPEQPVCVPRDAGMGAELSTLTKRCIDAIVERIDKLDTEKSFAEGEVEKLEELLVAFKKDAKARQFNFDDFCDTKKSGITRQRVECASIGRLVDRVAQILKKPEIVESAPTPKPPTCLDMPNCTECELRAEFGKTPSERYTELVDIMADQCHIGKNLSAKDKAKWKAEIYASIGFCSEYNYTGKQDKKARTDARIQQYRTVPYERLRGKDFGTLNSYNQFDDIFGLPMKDAVAAFCDPTLSDGTKLTTSFDRQRNFDIEMNHSNRHSEGADRFETGWQYCDAEIQIMQGKNTIQGLRLTAAKDLATRHWGKVLNEKGKPWNPENKLGYYNLDAASAGIGLPWSKALRVIDWNKTDGKKKQYSGTMFFDESDSFKNKLMACAEKTPESGSAPGYYAPTAPNPGTR